MNKQGWTYKKLGEVAKISSGKSIPSSEINSYYSDGLYPCFGGNGIRGYVNSYSYDGLYPIVGRVGALCGNVHLSQGKFYATEHALVVSLKTNVNPRYIEHTLTHLNLRHYAKGVAQPVLSASTLSAIPIPVPPIAEQERIVAELDLLSSIIEKKKAQLKELDQLAQSIFYDMFGDPITNEKGWEVKKLEEVASFINGDRGRNYPSQNDFVKDGIPFINAGHLHDGIIDFHSMNYINEEKYTKLNSGKIQEGDILFCLRGSLGKKAIVKGIKQGAIASSLVIIRCLKVVNLYLYFFLGSSLASSYIKKNNNGSSQPNLSAKSVSHFRIPIPPLPLQQEFAEKVEAIEKQKALIQQSIDEVQTLFDSRMDYRFG